MFITIISLLAFYFAFNLGANDVANAMGTSVGSKAVTLKQALMVAGVLEFTGAVLFGRKVTETLATKIANPSLFAQTPQILVIGMVTVLLSCGIWLQIATWWGLPVSSSHAVVGAIAGFSWVASGINAIDRTSIAIITLAWIVTPLASGAIAALFYTQIKWWILEQPQQLKQLNEWIPWLSTILLAIFGFIVLPAITSPVASFFEEKFGIKIPAHDLLLLIAGMGAVGLSFYGWRQLDEKIALAATPLTTNNIVEQLFGKFQFLSACFVSFAHGSNDVGNCVAPLVAIAYIHTTGQVPTNDITIPIWILILGGAGIVTGLAVWGKKVITTIGENIIPLQPSSGFCAELATATTILLASRLGLPVSTSHALVGSVVGIGLAQKPRSVQVKTLQNIASAWIITVPFSAGLSAFIFSIVEFANAKF